MLSLGIDVGGVRKGFDLVLLDGSRAVVACERRVALESLDELIGGWQPDVVAIDSPPGWAKDSIRKTEAAVLALGLQLYRTPWLDEQKSHPFYGWMQRGFLAFASAQRCGFALFDGAGSVAGRAMEVFPHAAATLLRGHKRLPGADEHHWRRTIIQDEGIDATALRGQDQVDAGLCALTGLMALKGRYCWCGVPGEGVIVLPCRAAELPARMPYASPRAMAMMAEFR